MPYIIQQKRERCQDGVAPSGSGELAFALCEVINRFLQSTPNGGFEGGISKVSGALHAARVAFEQDVMIPYETEKKHTNGPVFAKWPNKHEAHR